MQQSLELIGECQYKCIQYISYTFYSIMALYPWYSELKQGTILHACIIKHYKYRPIESERNNTIKLNC